MPEETKTVRRDPIQDLNQHTRDKVLNDHPNMAPINREREEPEELPGYNRIMIDRYV